MEHNSEKKRVSRFMEEVRVGRDSEARKLQQVASTREHQDREGT